MLSAFFAFQYDVRLGLSGFAQSSNPTATPCTSESFNVTNNTNLCLIKKAFLEKGLVRPRNAMLIFRVYDHKTLIIQQKPKRKKDETKEDLFSALLH